MAVQTSVFQMRTLLKCFFVNYLVEVFVENFDVPNSKFGRVVPQLLKCLFYGQYSPRN